MKKFIKQEQWIQERVLKGRLFFFAERSKYICQSKKGLKELIEGVKANSLSSIYLIDCANDFDYAMNAQLKNADLYILQPQNLTDLMVAIDELVALGDENATLVLHDWDGFWSLLKNHHEIIDINALISDIQSLAYTSNVIISSYPDTNIHTVLAHWSSFHAESDRLILESTMNTDDNYGVIYGDDEYNNFVEKLNTAMTKEDLMDIRQAIQSNSNKLSNQQKAQLSEVYKTNLNRIKSLETNIEMN